MAKECLTCGKKVTFFTCFGPKREHCSFKCWRKGPKRKGSGSLEAMKYNRRISDQNRFQTSFVRLFGLAYLTPILFIIFWVMFSFGAALWLTFLTVILIILQPTFRILYYEYKLRDLKQGKHHEERSKSDASALGELKLRLAKGEINTQEYNKKKKIITEE